MQLGSGRLPTSKNWVTYQSNPGAFKTIKQGKFEALNVASTGANANIIFNTERKVM